MNFKNYSLLLLCVYILTFNIKLLANDSSFYAEGGTLIPLQETSIELKREVLNLVRKNDEMEVQVRFEFFNPGETKTLTVGFVTPPAVGDLSPEESEHPQIRDFQVMVENRLLPFQVKTLEGTDFKVSEDMYFGADFVYYFEVFFPSGTTTIQQAYTYRGGLSVETSADFNYRLTNAKGWANKAIGEFELNVHFGKNAYFSVPHTFLKSGKMANWQVIGVGRIAEKAHSVFGSTTFRMVKIQNGYLQFKATNFQPDYDIFFADWHAHNEVNFWTDSVQEHVFQDMEMALITDFYYKPEELQSLSKYELRWLRNYLFAKHGYIFKSKDLQSFFEQCNWYIPNPNVKAEPAILTEKERKLFEAIVAAQSKN